MTHSLFSEFAPVSKEDWIHQASQDLKGKDFEQSLSSKLWDCLKVDPFYTLDDFKENPSAQFRFHFPSSIPGMPPRIWQNIVSILPGDTNAQILHTLENGAEGLVMSLNGLENLEELLDNVQPEYLSIFIKPTGNPLLALGNFISWIERTGIPAEHVSGAFLWSPSDLVFDRQGGYPLALEVFSEVMEMTEAYPNFKSFTLQTSRYSESGANPLEAIVFSLGEMIELIDRSGKWSPEFLFQKVLLEAAIGEAHFGEIARMKAFRQAVVQLAGLYQLEVRAEDFQLFCSTSSWSKSLFDVHTNLIRQTYEAMAGVLGGANYLWVRPFQEENTGELERRIARNVSSILREEVYLDKVMDPASGSYFLENLIQSMLGFLGVNLKNMEENGGWLNELESGKIHHAVRASRQKVQAEFLDQKRIKVGVNKYPASEKLKKDYAFEIFEEKSFELNPTRASYLFELQNQSSR